MHASTSFYILSTQTLAMCVSAGGQESLVVLPEVVVLVRHASSWLSRGRSLFCVQNPFTCLTKRVGEPRITFLLSNPISRTGMKARNHIIYTKPTDRPFQNNRRPFAQLGSTNPGPSGKCTFVNPSGMATSRLEFTVFPPPPPEADEDANVRPLGYNVTVPRLLLTIPSGLTCPDWIGTRYTIDGGAASLLFIILFVLGSNTSNSTYFPYNRLRQSS